MAYKFKKQIFGFMDLLRFKKMVPKRRKHLAQGASTPLAKSYRVNETAAILHPGQKKASLCGIEKETSDTRTYTFELPSPMFFKAGQYVTVRATVGESIVQRPYAISSSPYTALKEKKLSVTVKKTGFFSGYLFENAKLGDEFTIGDPSGDFCHDGIRDCKHVVAIAGGSGITPFYSMAQAIKEESEDFDLTLIYGAKTQKDIAFAEKLKAIAGEKFRFVCVLSDEKVKGYEHGFITADIIKKYAPESEYTVMMCGPEAMYAFVSKELAGMGITGKRVRKEANCIGNRDVKPNVYRLTVNICGERKEIEARAEETLLTAMERAGLKVPSKCRAGGCGYCHSKLVSGKFTVGGADKRRLADLKFGYVHPCCSYPDSDVELIVPAD